MANHAIPCGIAIPQVFLDGPVDTGYIRRFVTHAEELGYDSLWVQEKIIGDFSMLEPVALLNYVAAVTTRARLGTSVLLTALRNPVQLAKSLSSLDHLSGGRLTVGIGVGGSVGRFVAEQDAVFGYSSEKRARRFVEGFKIMKLLWTEPRASFEGTFWSFKDVAMEPKPVQKPYPPLWFGGHKEVALKRAVAHGDGWMGAGSSSADRFVTEVERVRRFLDETQRDPATFGISKRVYLAVDNDRSRAEKRLREFFAIRYKNADLGTQVSIRGSSQEVTEKLNDIIRKGARHLVLNPVFDEMEHLELLAEEVTPNLKEKS